MIAPTTNTFYEQNAAKLADLTNQNMVGYGQRARNQASRSPANSMPTSPSFLEQRGATGQRFAGAKELSNIPENMDSQTQATMKNIGGLGNYSDQQSAGVYYGDLDPTKAENADSIFSRVGYKPTAGTYDTELKNIFGDTPTAWGKNYLSKEMNDVTTRQGLKDQMGIYGYQDVTDPWNSRNQELDFLYQNTDIGKIKDMFFSKSGVPQYNIGAAGDFNSALTDMWNKRAIEKIQKQVDELPYELGNQVNQASGMPIIGSDNDPYTPPQQQNGWGMGSDNDPRPTPAPRMQDLFRYNNHDYLTEQEALDTRNRELQYVLGDKNLARNAYADLLSGGTPGMYDYLSPDQNTDPNTYSNYQNIGKLGWNGVNENITDPNAIKLMYGGRDITGADGSLIGTLYGKDQFVDPTETDRTIDNSHTNKNALIKTQIQDYNRGRGYSGSQMDMSKLYNVGSGAFDWAKDDLSPQAQMLGDYQSTHQYGRAPELTGLGQVVKTGLQVFGGPVGTIAGLALQGAGGQRPGLGQMLGSFVGMSGATNGLGQLGSAAANAGIGAVGALADGRNIGQALRQGALSGLGSYAGGYVGDSVSNSFGGELGKSLGSGAGALTSGAIKQLGSGQGLNIKDLATRTALGAATPALGNIFAGQDASKEEREKYNKLAASGLSLGNTLYKTRNKNGTTTSKAR